MQPQRRYSRVDDKPREREREATVVGGSLFLACCGLVGTVVALAAITALILSIISMTRSCCDNEIESGQFIVPPVPGPFTMSLLEVKKIKDNGIKKRLNLGTVNNFTDLVVKYEKIRKQVTLFFGNISYYDICADVYYGSLVNMPLNIRPQIKPASMSAMSVSSITSDYWCPLGFCFGEYPPVYAFIQYYDDVNYLTVQMNYSNWCDEPQKKITNTPSEHTGLFALTYFI